MSAEVPHGEVTFGAVRPFADLRDSGLLWLINRVVFHPRGYALGLSYDPAPRDSLPAGGVAVGWILQGDGSEPWTMGDPSPELVAQGFKTEDELFRLVKALLR